jgi:DNA-binding GntR family transcriptional regulator
LKHVNLNLRHRVRNGFAQTRLKGKELGPSTEVHSSLPDEESGTARFDRIFHEVRDRICLLAYPPGTVLSEAVLAKEFGVSRTPIRRVFHKLEFMGLVHIRNGVGTIVTDIDLKTFKETYDLRKRLAELMGELSAVEIRPDHVTRIEGLLTKATKLEPQRGDFDGLAQISNDLQQLLSDLTGNTPLREIIELLYYRVARIWFTFLPQFGWDDAIANQIRELRDIRTAMVNGDTRGVGQYRSIELQRMLTLLGRLLVDG